MVFNLSNNFRNASWTSASVSFKISCNKKQNYQPFLALKQHFSFAFKCLVETLKSCSMKKHSIDELKPVLYHFVVVCLRFLSLRFERANCERPRVVTLHNMHLPLTKFKFSMRHAFGGKICSLTLWVNFHCKYLSGIFHVR